MNKQVDKFVSYDEALSTSNVCQLYMSDVILLKYNVSVEQLRYLIIESKLLETDADCRKWDQKTRTKGFMIDINQF